MLQRFTGLCFMTYQASAAARCAYLNGLLDPTAMDRRAQSIA
jgi:hypothetical protein